MTRKDRSGHLHDRYAAEDQDRAVVAVGLAGGMLLLDPGERRVHLRRIVPDLRLQERLEAVEAELLARGVAGLRDAVGVEADELVRRERDLRGPVGAAREEGDRQAV